MSVLEFRVLGFGFFSFAYSARNVMAGSSRLARIAGITLESAMIATTITAVAVQAAG
jgi:hypothetical protein